MPRRVAPRLMLTGLMAFITLVGGFVAAAGPSAASPAGWTPPTPVRSTQGVRSPVFATAPDGADLMVWKATDSTGRSDLDSRLRPSGQNTWITVPTGVAGLASLTGIAVQAAPDGDFWLAFTTKTQTTPAVSVMRLDHRTQSWTRRLKPFASADYYFDSPQLAVGGDGSVVIGAVAIDAADDSHSRAVVAVKSSNSSPWQTTYLSPPDQRAWPAVAVAANRSGQLVVSWELVTSAPYQIWAAARAARPGSSWRSQQVAQPSTPADVSLALAPDGTAALAFADGSGFPTGQITVALDDVGTASTWQLQPVAASDSASLVTGVPLVTVTKAGTPIVVYSRSDTNGTVTETSSHVSGDWTPAVAVSRASWEDSAPIALLPQTNGAATVLYQQYTTGGSPTDLGLRVRTIRGADLAPARVVTTSADHPASSAALGVTAAGGTVVAWRENGPPPEDEIETSGTAMTAPRVVADAFSSTQVRHTVVSGQARVGHRLSCGTGYWVEARRLAYTWLRDGHRLHGATHPTYRVRRRDTGHRLACMATASNASTQHTVLTGAPVRISRALANAPARHTTAPSRR